MVTGAFGTIRIGSVVTNRKCEMIMSDTVWKFISLCHKTCMEERGPEVCGGSMDFGSLSVLLTLYCELTQANWVSHNS